MNHFAWAGAIALSVASASSSVAECYRLQCASSQSCQPYQTQSGNCCCQVNCEGGEGGPSCSCTTSCSKSCSENCPGCPCGEGPTGGFLYTPESAERLRGEHPLTVLVLQNLKNPKSRRVHSAVAEGRASLAGGPDFAYKAIVTANEDSLVVDYVFARVGKGPRPQNARVEVDPEGRAVTTPLSSADAEQVVRRVGLACGVPRT